MSKHKYFHLPLARKKYLCILMKYYPTLYDNCNTLFIIICWMFVQNSIQSPLFRGNSAILLKIQFVQSDAWVCLSLHYASFNIIGRYCLMGKYWNELNKYYVNIVLWAKLFCYLNIYFNKTKIRDTYSSFLFKKKKVIV